MSTFRSSSSSICLPKIFQVYPTQILLVCHLPSTFFFRIAFLAALPALRPPALILDECPPTDLPTAISVASASADVTPAPRSPPRTRPAAAAAAGGGGGATALGTLRFDAQFLGGECGGRGGGR